MIVRAAVVPHPPLLVSSAPATTGAFAGFGVHLVPQDLPSAECYALGERQVLVVLEPIS